MATLEEAIEALRNGKTISISDSGKSYTQHLKLVFSKNDEIAILIGKLNFENDTKWKVENSFSIYADSLLGKSKFEILE